MSRKGGTGGGGWVALGAPKGENSMAMSGLAHEKPWLEQGRHFSLFKLKWT